MSRFQKGEFAVHTPTGHRVQVLRVLPRETTTGFVSTEGEGAQQTSSHYEVRDLVDEKEMRVTDRVLAADDAEARKAILRKFYEVYEKNGLSVVVQQTWVAHELRLDAAVARRCFEYLSSKGYIRPMTLGGGYAPTSELIDAVERGEAA